MDLARALGDPGFQRAPSDYREECLQRFLRAWSLLLKNHPPSSPSPSFLSFLTEAEATRLSDLGKQQSLRHGQKVYTRGDRAVSFGLVLQGTFIMSDMQDLRIRPQTTATRPNTRAGTAPRPDDTLVLHQGDTFGEVPLALDGQIVGGLRESSLQASNDENIEHIIFVIDYQKFAAFMQELPTSRVAPSAVAGHLLSKVLPRSQKDAPWMVKTKGETEETVSVAPSDSISPSRKKGKVLDSLPVTMLNMDVLMQCAWLAKREGVVSDTTRAVMGNETRIPHTVVFRDGELVQWYFGWLSSLKKRGKEHLSTWQVIEEFCKGSDAGHLVAIMTCHRRGNSMGKEHAQCRLLDRRRLESVLSGAKANKLTGYIQKYQRIAPAAVPTEHVLQCCWSNLSFTVDWVPEEKLECLTQIHKPSRMDPGGNKKLHEKMCVQYHQYVPGNLSALGDHFNSQMIKLNPLGQLDWKSRSRARQFNDITLDTKGGSVVERELRDTVKTSCQQIASTFDKIVNKSQEARTKAIDDATEFNLHHSPTFTLIRSLTCFFKVNKDGQPILMHCTAAVSHPETKPPLTALARAELFNPSEETFYYFAGYGAEHQRLSGLGERGVLLDFSEFLQLLTKKGLLYDHVSMTDAAVCFKHACEALNAEDGQLKYPDYCKCMAALRSRMGLTRDGKAKAQQGINRTKSDSLENLGMTEEDLDDRMVGVMNVRSQQDRARVRMGGMFASSIIQKMTIRHVERRAQERDRKHDERAAELRKRVAEAAAIERKALEEHRKKAFAQAAKRQQEAEDSAKKSWEKIEHTNQMIMQQRAAQVKKIQDETEARRQASIQKLKQRRQAEAHRISELTKRSELLERHRSKVYAKQKAVEENTREYKYIAGREKEVVREMFQEYVQTGHLVKPWGLVDLSGDALPSLIEIATDKSKGYSLPKAKGAEEIDATVLLSVIPEKGILQPKRRSHSSFE